MISKIRLPQREGVQYKNSWLELEDVKNQSSYNRILFSPPIISYLSIAHCFPAPSESTPFSSSVHFSILIHFSLSHSFGLGGAFIWVPPPAFMDCLHHNLSASLPTVNCNRLSMCPSSNSQEWEADGLSSPFVPDHVIGFWQRQSLGHVPPLARSPLNKQTWLPRS